MVLQLGLALVCCAIVSMEMCLKAFVSSVMEKIVIDFLCYGKINNYENKKNTSNKRKSIL